MIINPAHYFLKRYHSPDLKAKELKRMLNLWFPFLMNRIQIISIKEDFHEMQVCLKHSFWNRNPNKSIWGGSITSTLDPFFPVMMKQIILRKGIHFKINDAEVLKAEEKLGNSGKYESWHTANGVDDQGNICVHGQVQVYLRRR